MSDPGRNETHDVEAYLSELTDEQAIEIMEGRAPATDPESAEAAAGALAGGLLSENTSASGSSKGSVVQMFVRQPWIRMAASVMVGIFVSQLYLGRDGMGTQAPGGNATANVVYLEVLRGGEEVPVVSIDNNDQWVSLVAYPHFGDAETLDVIVEKASRSGQESSSWEGVMRDTISSGLEDAVVINVPAKKLKPGDYRLRISAKDDAGAEALMVRFRVES